MDPTKIYGAPLRARLRAHRRGGQSMNIRELEQSSPRWMYDVRDQLKRHVYNRSERAFAAGDAARDSIVTREALRARQGKLRQYLIEHSLGGLPPMNTPLEAQVVGSVEGDGF